MLGSKPLITKKVYLTASRYLKKVDERNIPHFVKALEEKEEYLAENMMQNASYLSNLHAEAFKKKHGIDMEESEINSMTLDIYIVGWFNYMVLDIARDVQFEKEMEGMWGKDIDDTDW